MQRSAIIGAFGPTNTGKTHRAIERMLDFETGMMGLPLRLLAREVYDKVATRVGSRQVALITGEEKRIPEAPRYFVCTVEAMPVERQVDFLAVDEIQLAGHPERGHVFTDRLLHARGTQETWFMGSETMTSLASELVPTIRIQRFPRLSSLSSFGSFALGSLPPRSVVVAFSAKRVYELAEKIRARKGGAAIVLGGLSPSARNAQVDMYQAGEVDYLVATDAIGMGLNLDVDRVAFADVRKFDGREWRELDVSEMAQIAGRAGRYTKDGAFGVFSREALPRGVTRAIEMHRFPAQRSLIFRRSDLDFSSPKALVDSLEEHPKRRALQLVADPEDTRTLKKLLRRDDVLELVPNEESLRLLWQLCQIPDYRQLLVDEHAHLIFEIFQLIQRHGRIPADFVHQRLDQLARHTGDIDTVTARISFIRTWNYVANHEGWVEKARELEERTRFLEDELSDALHLALLERFVGRRKLGGRGGAPRPERPPAKPDFSLQLKALRAELACNVQPRDLLLDVLGAAHAEISLELGGGLRFREVILGALRPGRSALELEVRVSDEHKGSGHEEKLAAFLRNWVREEVRLSLGPLAKGFLNEETSKIRGILYQLRKGWGVVPASEVRTLLVDLGTDEREQLEKCEILLGKRWCVARSLLTPSAIRRRAPLVLSSLSREAFVGSRQGAADSVSPRHHLECVGSALLSRGELTKTAWSLLGYAVVGPQAIRIDLLEALLLSRETLLHPEFEREVVRVLACGEIEARELVRHLSPRPKRRRRKRVRR